jgi:hypothetical protein
MQGMNWMAWGGLLIWLFVLALVIWAVVEVIRYVRSTRAK